MSYESVFFYPRTSVPAKDLEHAIMKWEADIELYERYGGILPGTIPKDEPRRHVP